uniref:Uncharacterized protein n=1 Tax=Kalanchoe fedtschenkoi TaxID=63787 RepID=A0A7N0T014_KALFE
MACFGTAACDSHGVNCAELIFYLGLDINGAKSIAIFLWRHSMRHSPSCSWLIKHIRSDMKDMVIGKLDERGLAYRMNYSGKSINWLDAELRPLLKIVKLEMDHFY